MLKKSFFPSSKLFFWPNFLWPGLILAILFFELSLKCSLLLLEELGKDFPDLDKRVQVTEYFSPIDPALFFRD